MPWQRTVVDTALEVDPTTERLAYREVVVVVPRQSGKTTLILPTITHRCLSFGGDQGCLYISHQRQKTLHKWKNEQLPRLQKSPFGAMFRPSLQTGMEALFWENGSRYGIDAPTQDAGHSLTLDLVCIDEAWRVPGIVEAGIGPTMITRPEPQRWIISTAGTPASAYLKSKVDRGRKKPDSGGTAYFEWSASKDADVDDEATWWDSMPALGYTQSIEAIRAERLSTTDDDFRRAYLNQWRDAAAAEQPLTAAQWSACFYEPPLPIGDPPVLGLDVWDNRWTIVASWLLPDARVALEVVDDGWDSTTVVGRLGDLAERHSPAAVTVDTFGPVASLIPDLMRLSVPLAPLSFGDMSAAWGRFVAEGRAERLAHCGHELLDAAVLGVAERKIKDRTVVDRSSCATNPTPLVAAVAAAWSVATQPPAPMLHF